MYPFGLVANVADNCTGATKQKALYLQYSYTPDLRSAPALDVTVRTDWTNISGIRKYGANGVFASHPFSTAMSIGGYFGSQVDGDVTQGGLLFSAWDYEVKPLNPACQGALPNATWCNHRHAWPVWRPGNPPSCRQNLLERSLMSMLRLTEEIHRHCPLSAAASLCTRGACYPLMCASFIDAIASEGRSALGVIGIAWIVGCILAGITLLEPSAG